jgi:hypothetical protein
MSTVSKKQIKKINAMLGRKSNKKQNKSMVVLPPTRQRKSKRGRIYNNYMPIGPGPNRVKSQKPNGLGLNGRLVGATNRRQQIIEEDEYIADVFGSTGYVATQYQVNPGNLTTFPWGSKLAQLYEEYDFHYLEFYYKRLVSEFATNGQAGEVILSIDYNASDVPPTTKQQVLDSEDHTPGMPCDDMILRRVDCSLLRTQPAKYILTGAQPANTDIKTYNCCNLYVSTNGNTNTTVMGELHVRYRCCLKKPVLEAGSVVGGVVHFSGTAPTTANNFATAVMQSGGTPSMSGITAAANVITFPVGIPGNYIMFMSVAGSTSASAIGATSQSAGVTLPNLFCLSGARDGISTAVSLAGTTTACAFISQSLTVAVGGGTVTLSNPSTLVGGNNMDLWIISLPVTLITIIKDPLQGVNAELAELRSMIKDLKKSRITVDSDFDDDEQKSSSSTSNLSNSTTLDVISELVARKNNMKTSLIK